MCHTRATVRPHKVDLQIIVTIFPIFQAGGRSLFIIHWPISFIKASHAPQKEGVASSLRRSKVNVDNRFIEISTNLGQFLLAKLNTVEKQTFLTLAMLKILDFVYFYMIMTNNE